MAKGKNMNPADAFRKAQRAKELKKNKENRAKARETATLKKDTSGLEKEIHELEDIGEEKLDSAQKAQLKELRTEVARIRKVKQDYVQAHPEQSHLVRGLEERPRRPIAEDAAASSAGSSTPAVRSVFGKNGLPLHPERSIYYDPVLNPYGMPPPGMPYVERPPLPHEIEEDHMQLQGISKDGAPDVDSVMNSGSSDSEEDASDDNDDDIVLPSGPPPGDSRAKEHNSGSESNSEDSDDDIPMPSGPPPPKAAPAPPLPNGPPPTAAPFFPGASYGTAFPPFPPTVQPFAHVPSHVPPPPGFPTTMYPGYIPPSAQMATPYPPQMPGPGREPRLPRDRQLAEAVRTIQDPLSHVPHVTYQAHQAQRHQLPAPPTTASGPQISPQHGLPPKPNSVPQTAASATIFAEPELRDLKKEATAFVPTSMRRAAKKGTSTNTSSALRIDAAPNEAEDQSGPSAEPRKDLMTVLGSQLGVVEKPSTSSNNKGGQGKDDYEKFLAEVGSFL